jgi:hypothetical protein
MLFNSVHSGQIIGILKDFNLDTEYSNLELANFLLPITLIKKHRLSDILAANLKEQQIKLTERGSAYIELFPVRIVIGKSE